MKLGIVDSSVGNGHMFSFSSLFNGYEPSELARCPFPAIISYLPKHITPVDALSSKAEVSAVWMHDLEYAMNVARFGKIVNVYSDINSLIENVDGIIITNDEPVGRESVLELCLASGKMVFIDKMIARTLENLNKILQLQCYPGQLYCASAISFSTAVNEIAWEANTEYMVFTAPKNWANYGIHVVDAFLIFASLNNLEYEIGKITHGDTASERQINILNPRGGKILLRTEGRADVNFSIKASKNGIEQKVTISDPFDAFAAMLNTWLSRDPAKTHLAEYKRYYDAVGILGCNPE
jgi:hypothetical protein